MKLHIELSGGLELLFDKVKIHDVDVPLPESGPLTVAALLPWMKQHLLVERSELFLAVDGDGRLSVRPGILVLVDSSDWELLGGLDTELENGATVTFISTLHGG